MRLSGVPRQLQSGALAGPIKFPRCPGPVVAIRPVKGQISARSRPRQKKGVGEGENNEPLRRKFRPEPPIHDPGPHTFGAPCLGLRYLLVVRS
jgi:hypothetical protein